MLVGHFAVGLVAKRMEPKISLGTFVLAAMAADLLWCVFMIAGIEHIEIKPGLGAANYIIADEIDFSHSLATDTIWAALFAFAYYLKRRNRRGAFVVFFVVISHWVLDFIAHKPDMPLAPGIQNYFGLGLWTSIPLTIVIEGGFWLLALALYIRVTQSKSRLGTYVFCGMVGFLTLAWYKNIVGPPQSSDPASMGVSSLIFFSLVVGWSYWMNRIRPVVREAQVDL
jgi:membrane-bound metal-dependent hydrolase YbcI (DUF457 family)